MKTIFISALMLVAMAVSLATPSTAQASTIYACELKAIGTIRIVSSTATCTKYETPISWDTGGAAGPAGPAGPQGPAGTALAYAHVLADGTIDTAQTSANIVVQRHYSVVDGSIDAGLYCIGVLGGTDGIVHVAVVSLDSRANVGGTVQASVFLASGCEGTGALYGNNIYVVTRPQLQDGGQDGIDRAFYLIVN